MLLKWQTNKNSPLRGSRGRIIELMLYRRFSALPSCVLSEWLHLSCDLSTSRIPEAPGPLPDAWELIPSTVLFCTEISHAVQLICFGGHSFHHYRNPDVFSALSQVFQRYWYLTWLLLLIIVVSEHVHVGISYIWNHDTRKLQIPFHHIPSHSGGQNKSQAASK